MDSPSLVERLQAMYSHRGDGFPTQFVNPDGPEAAARIAALETELERRKYDGLHTCHDECPRTACVLRRENARLSSIVVDFRESLTNGERNRETLLSINHDELRGLVERARTALKGTNDG